MYYGKDWERAWNKHVKQWDGSKYDNYTSGFEMNQLEPNSLLRTVDEQIDEPYPDNLHMRCHPRAASLRPVQRLSAKFNWTIDELGLECQVLGRRILKDGDVVYKIRTRPDTINNSTKESSTEDSSTEWSKHLDGVPRQAVIFADKPYTTDIHMHGAFRHAIGLPESMVPKIWKNLQDPPPDVRKEAK